MANCYFVWHRNNGQILCQKQWGEMINAETGKEYPYVMKIKLTGDEKLLTLNELENKYPYQE